METRIFLRFTQWLQNGIQMKYVYLISSKNSFKS